MITINGKTYKQKYFSGIYPIEEQLLKWIVEGLLEEVKEKPLSQKRAEAIERGKEQELLKKVQSEYKIFKESEKKMLEEDEKQRELFFGEPSILEKLREEMERKVQQTIEQIEKTQQIRDCERLNTLREILDLLTSLETPQAKKSDIPSREYMDKMCIPEQPQFTPGQKVSIHNPICSSGSSSTADKWTPTPGQMIEVSNDGEKWEKREFAHTGRGIALADKTIYFYTTGLDPEYNDGRKLGEGWKFARPIKIEPELPEFNYEKLEENIRDVEFEKLDELRHMIGHIGKQTEALTKAVQALSRQKTTK